MTEPALPSHAPAPKRPVSVEVRQGLRRGLVLGILVVCAMIAVGGALAVVPLATRNFSGAMIEYGCPGPGICFPPNESPSLQFFPEASSVSMSWHSGTGESIQFYVVGPTGGLVSACSGQGLTGSCSFKSAGGSYSFDSHGLGPGSTTITVDFAGTFTAPIL